MGPDDGISALIRRGKETKVLSLSTSVRSQLEGHCLQTRKRALTRSQICWHLDLGLSASRIMRNRYLLFQPPSVWYFVMAVQAY